jgi:hypothetical protein
MVHGVHPPQAWELCPSPFLLPWDLKHRPCSWGSPGQRYKVCGGGGCWIPRPHPKTSQPQRALG